MAGRQLGNRCSLRAPYPSLPPSPFFCSFPPLTHAPFYAALCLLPSPPLSANLHCTIHITCFSRFTLIWKLSYVIARVCGAGASFYYFRLRVPCPTTHRQRDESYVRRFHSVLLLPFRVIIYPNCPVTDTAFFGNLHVIGFSRGVCKDEHPPFLNTISTIFQAAKERRKRKPKKQPKCANEQKKYQDASG